MTPTNSTRQSPPRWRAFHKVVNENVTAVYLEGSRKMWP
jgi:hypothetical protein